MPNAAHNMKPVIECHQIKITDEQSDEWDYVEPMLQTAVSLKDFTQTCTTDDIRKSLVTDHAEMFLFSDGLGGEMVMVTAIMPYPQTKMFEIGFAAGHDAESLFQAAFDFAKERGRYYGCDYVRVFGRSGWLKKIADKKVATTLWDVKL